MNSFFTDILKLPGAATVLASILIGRVIGQVARGFSEDEEVVAQATLYKTIYAKYPDDTVEVAAMFKRMLDNAEDNSSTLDGLDLTEEEKAQWADSMGTSEREQIRTSVRPLVDLLNGLEPCEDAWGDLGPLAQYSLAVRTERNLANSIERYKTWTSEEGARLLQQATDALPKLVGHVSDLAAEYKDELEQARSNGINIATRRAA